MKITKDQARQQVDVYGELLQERAVIDEIEKIDIRGVTHYRFTLLDTKYPMNFECASLKELATVLSCMWSTYIKVYGEMGVDLSSYSI